MDEASLLHKLRLIEALYAGAATEGERDAAAAARERLRERLKTGEKDDPPIEYTFKLGDGWNKKLFLALLRRYGLRPYRYPYQRHTTVMARVSRSFVDGTLWPQYRELSRTLAQHLGEITDRVIAGAIHSDSSDAEVVPEQRRLAATGV